MLAIKNNIMAENAARHLGRAYDDLATSVERLSSGLRINSAKDDAAGLAVRELMRADIAVLRQGSRNAQDGISMIQTMEGATAVMDENLIRMKELAEQAATGSYSAAQRVIMDAEFSQMADEIERIAGATAFNGITMLDTAPTATNAVAIHVGSTTTIDIAQVDMTKSGLNIETGDGGWQAYSTTANGVDASSDTWLTITQGCGGALTTTLTIGFEDSGTTANNESDIVVALTVLSSAATTFSLASVVSNINNASNALGWDASGNDLRYSAASAYLDTTSSKYVLRLESRDSNADSYSMAFSGIQSLTGVGSCGSVTGGFNVNTAENIAGGASLSVNGTDDMQAGVTQAGLNILTVAAATSALTTITTAIDEKDSGRAAFGYKMNRLESSIANLGIQTENLLAAESRISDVDVATEMAALTRTQVLSQAGIAMLAQATTMPQMALTLLR